MLDLSLQKIKKIHCIGIGGVGMSAVAKILKDKGFIVTGSDDNAYPPATTLLEENGISIYNSYNPSNIPKDVDLVVIGRNKKLLKGNNDEVDEAYNRNLLVTSFPEILNSLTMDTHNIVCTGSVGKTTCASIIAWCLINANKSPSFFIGGIPHNMGTSSKIDKGEYFVLEGDEYPISHDARTSKFMSYNSTDILITSITHDHLDIFPTQESYNKPFIDLIKSLPPDGRCVINIDSRETDVLLPINHIKTTYGFSDKAQWSADNIQFKEKTTFSIKRNMEKIADIETSLIGKHNVLNIVGVAALLLGGEYITVDEFIDGVKKYKGVKNRLEKLNKNSNISLYEGYGSSYEKSRAAILSLLPYKKNRLIVLFEPYATSWGIKGYLSKYKKLFDDVDIAYMYTSTFKSKEISIEDIKNISNTPINIIDDCDRGFEEIQQNLEENDILLTLSSGTIGGLRDKITNWIDAK